MASPSDFYNAVYSKAVELGANDVQARLAAAQASEETGYGQHMVGNNLFGIKAGANYAGPSVNAGTNEEYNGQLTSENANFRSYDDFTQSVADYLGVIQKNFPDAWNAQTFADAVAGLNTGVYGKYATLSDYGNHINAIDSKYGGTSYAQNPENVPTPYSPDNLTDGSLLSAFQETPKADDPFSSILTGQQPVDVSASSVLGGTPALEASTKAGVPGGPSGNFDGIVTPGNIDLGHRQVATMPDGSIATVRSMSFQDDAGNEVLVPTVSPTGDLLTDQQAKDLYGKTGQQLGVFDTPANADKYAEALHQAQEQYYAPSDLVPASGILSGNAPLEANATASILSNSTPSDRMGIAEPGFDNSRFDGLGASVATDFDQGRFAAPATAAFDASRFGPSVVDPATNTQSFMDQPAAPADLSGFANAYAAQRGPTSGLLSADAQTVQGMAEKQMADARATAPALSVPAGGFLAGNAPLEAQASVPSLASAYTAPTAVAPAEQAIDNVTTSSTAPSILSGSQIATSNGPLSFTPSTGIMAGQPLQQSQFVSSFPTAVAQNKIEPATVNDVVAAPTLDTIQVADQPSIASVDDVTGTSPVQQQKTQAVNSTVQAAKQQATPAAQKSLKDSILSKETALGSILGGTVLGPPGAILGGVLGQQVSQNGGLTGLMGGGFATPTTQIGGGIANIGGIYAGRYAPGTYSVANNGAQITSLGGGYTGMVTPSGQHEVISPTGQISHDFSKPSATV